MKPFKFKQFIIRHHRSAVKVGTDSILLGAWARITENDRRMLDIGTGCGLLALMCAQKSTNDCHIDAIEIDGDSVTEANENVINSRWNDRITIIPTSFQDYWPSTPYRYHHIITNPPYFDSGRPAQHERRSKARHHLQLTFEDILQGSIHLLTDDGSLSLVLPVEAGRQFINLGRNLGMYPARITAVHSRTNKQAERWLIELKRGDRKVVQNTIIIHPNEDNSYGEEFLTITKDFYLLA